ncbi:retrovirus-related pol polyprotein from transposon TNT 1-94, partial [Tanacetum coccineum]
LMFGSDLTSHVRHSRLIDEFDKFAAKEGESLESVYERLTTLVNIMDRNNVRPIPVSINTKILNCLQPEWSKYVTMYVTHPSSVVDYEDEYQGELQGDSQEDKLTTAVIFDIQTKNTGYGGNGNRNAGRQNRNQTFNSRNGNDDNNQIVQLVPRTESSPGKANVQCYNCNEKGHYARDFQKSRVRDAKTSKDNEDPSWNTSTVQEKLRQGTTSALESALEDFILIVLLLVRKHEKWVLVIRVEDNATDEGRVTFDWFEM